MATTRFKGESGSDRLGVSTISDSDMIQVRHKPGTVDDADKGVSKAVLNSCPFGVSSTAAATAAKTASLTDSNPDFTLISGREVVVCFSAANSASSPSLNFAGSGAYPIYYPDGTAVENWDAGTWMHLKYFEATINDTLTQRWICLSPVVANSITSGDKRPAASGAVDSACLKKFGVSGFTLLDANLTVNTSKSGSYVTTKTTLFSILNQGSAGSTNIPAYGRIIFGDMIVGYTTFDTGLGTWAIVPAGVTVNYLLENNDLVKVHIYVKQID